jgi:hypothetical protein
VSSGFEPPPNPSFSRRGDEFSIGIYFLLLTREEIREGV